MTVTLNENEHENYFANSMIDVKNVNSKLIWKQIIKAEDECITFKLDTGAKINVFCKIL